MRDLVPIEPADAEPPALPADERDLAFDVWFSVGLQSYAETSRRLRVNESTLRSWGRRDGWRQRALQRNLDVAPEELRHVTGVNLQMAAVEASAYLYNVTAGRVEPNRARQQAAIATLHMAGWAPAHYLPTRRAEPKPPRQLPDLDTLSPDQLRDLERQLTAGE